MPTSSRKQTHTHKHTHCFVRTELFPTTVLSKLTHSPGVLSELPGEYKGTHPMTHSLTECWYWIGGPRTWWVGGVFAVGGGELYKGWCSQMARHLKTLSEEIASFCNVWSQQKKLVILAPGDMEADSLHLGGEWQFNHFSKLISSRPDAAFAEIQRTSLPEKSPLSSETQVNLCDDLAPVARQPAPRKKLPLSSRRPAAVGAGLQNMGNTCYLNASLQCLTYTPPLANYMLSREHS